MIYSVAGGIVLLVIVISELRRIRNRRADRLAVLGSISRAIGIGPAVKVGTDLGWLGEGDVSSDGDAVRIRLRRWRPWR